MTLATQKHERTIADGLARLLATARDTRGLTPLDLLPRVVKAIEKTFQNFDPPKSEIENSIASLHVDDLCLILACERGDEAAWSELFTNFGGAVRAAARKVTRNPDAAEDLAQSIWAELHGLRVGADGKPSGKIGYYSGRGSLAGWLRAVVAQLAVDAHRKNARLVQIEETREFENLAHRADEHETAAFHQNSDSLKANPENSLLEKAAQKDVETALAKAIGELEPADRLLLKLYYFDNLNLKQAASILNFHEATASRRLVKIQANLRKRVESILASENRWKLDEIRQTLERVAGVLQTDIEKIVKDG